MSYKKLKESIETAPMTWLPALLIRIVEVSYKKNVFQPGGATQLIQKVEAKMPFNKKLNPKQAKCVEISDRVGMGTGGGTIFNGPAFPPEG